MKDTYLVVPSVLKTINNAIRRNTEIPIVVTMHSDLKKLYDEELKDFANDELVMSCIQLCRVVVDDTISTDAVYCDVPVL